MTPLGYCMGCMLYVGFQFQSQASRLMPLDNLYSSTGYDRLAVWVGILHLENHWPSFRFAGISITNALSIVRLPWSDARSNMHPSGQPLWFVCRALCYTPVFLFSCRGSLLDPLRPCFLMEPPWRGLGSGCRTQVLPLEYDAFVV